VTLIPAADVHDSSDKLYHHLRESILQNRQKRMELRSLKPFGVQLSVYPYIKKLGIFMIYLFLSNHVVTLLVTFPADVVK